MFVFRHLPKLLQKQKQHFSIEDFIEQLPSLLDELQHALLQQSQSRLSQNTLQIETRAQFEAFLTSDRNQATLAQVYLEDCEATRELLSEQKLSFRCKMLEAVKDGTAAKPCVITGNEQAEPVLNGQSY